MKVLNLTERNMASYQIDGYHTLGEKFPFTQELLELMNVAFSAPVLSQNENTTTTIEKLLEQTKAVFSKHYTTNLVDYCSKEQSLELERLEFTLTASAKSNETYDEFYDARRKTITKKDPFDLPVLYYQSEENTGEIATSYVGIPLQKHIHKTKKCYNHIILTGYLNPELAATYGHEITHALVPIGGCLNFQYSELLPIFNEKLVAYELDPTGELLKRVNATRNKELVKSLIKIFDKNPESKYEIFLHYVYIQSTLLATKLFDMYINANDLEKQIIISRIQDVFDGKYPVEALLHGYNITFENSCDAEIYKKYI